MSEYQVPDAIEPVEGFRSWLLMDGKLVSLTNDEEWKPGEPLSARCVQGMGARYRWVFSRDGMNLQQAYERAHSQVDVSGFGASQGYLPVGFGYGETTIPSPPALEPPDGYGFSLERITHDAPSDDCTCGIYATTAEDRIPGTGNVYGKVKLWGKVIPAARGYRAERAYPSEFWVSPEMEPNDTLLAFGVPIIIKDDLPNGAPFPTVYFTFPSTAFSFKAKPNPNWPRRIMLAAAAINLGCAAFNLSVAFHVL